jgi:hypothetical protein
MDRPDQRQPFGRPHLRPRTERRAGRRDRGFGIVGIAQRDFGDGGQVRRVDDGRAVAPCGVTQRPPM